MTVNEQTPFIEYSGNGVSTLFAFIWTQQEIDDMRVTIDSVEGQRGIDYEVTDFNPEDGGNVVILPAPESGVSILIERITPITQQLDYIAGSPFPAETHEEQMDKDTLILQEQILGSRIAGQGINLDAQPGANFVDVTNSAGNDARIPSYDCVNPLAGVFHGEITNSAPADSTVTEKDDGYVWFETA